MDKDYFVPFADFGEDRFEEKRSKFTGRLWHVETAEDAVAKIKEMREKCATRTTVSRRARQACPFWKCCATRT